MLECLPPSCFGQVVRRSAWKYVSENFMPDEKRTIPVEVHTHRQAFHNGIPASLLFRIIKLVAIPAWIRYPVIFSNRPTVVLRWVGDWSTGSGNIAGRVAISILSVRRIRACHFVGVILWCLDRTTNEVNGRCNPKWSSGREDADRTW